jgi:hypothetical protein
MPAYLEHWVYVIKMLFETYSFLNAQLHSPENVVQSVI